LCSSDTTKSLRRLPLSVLVVLSCSVPARADDAAFDALAQRFIEEFSALHPVAATKIVTIRNPGKEKRHHRVLFLVSWVPGFLIHKPLVGLRAEPALRPPSVGTVRGVSRPGGDPHTSEFPHPLEAMGLWKLGVFHARNASWGV